jgi:hypothetical protein
MAAQVAMEAIARSEAVVTGLAIERSPVVVKSRPPQVRTLRPLVVQEAVCGARGGVPHVLAVTSAMCVSSVLLVLRVAAFVANTVVTASFGTRTPIAVVG